MPYKFNPFTGEFDYYDHIGSVQDEVIAGKLPNSSFSGLTKISVGITQPTSPSTGDLWVDTN